MILFFLIVFVNFCFALNLFAERKFEEEKIVVSGYALYKVLKEVFPEEKLYLLQPPKGEFHFFEPTPSQWRLLKKAEIVIVVGTEPWIKRLYTLRKNKATFSLCKKGEKLKDPHLWFNLSRVEKLLENLINFLKKKENKNLEHILKKFAVFEKKLKKFREEKRFLLHCKYKKVFLLGHPVFYYLFKGTGIQEISLIKGHYHEGEPSIQSLLKIIQEVKKREKKVVFLTDPEFVKYKETFENQGIKVIELWSGDTMMEGGFFELLKRNLYEFKRSLECKNPENK